MKIFRDIFQSGSSQVIAAGKDVSIRCSGDSSVIINGRQVAGNVSTKADKPRISKTRPVAKIENCINCGANHYQNGLCAYCGTEKAEPKRIKQKKIRGDMNTYDFLEGVIITGDMNTIDHAKNCTIKGDMNTIKVAENCVITGDMNTVIERL